MKKNLNSCKVIFKDASLNYTTSVAGHVTEQDCKNYFVGSHLNVGGEDEVHECIAIQFIDNNQECLAPICMAYEQVVNFLNGGGLKVWHK